MDHTDTFNLGLLNVLQQVHPHTTISSKGLQFIIDFNIELIYNILKSYGETENLQNAVFNLIGGELGRHAICEGTKAVARYQNSNTDKKTRWEMSGLQFSVLLIEQIIK